VTRRRRVTSSMLERVVVDSFLDVGPLTRAEIVATTGLTRQVVASLIDELVISGRLLVVRPSGEHAGPGRPSTRYRLASASTPVAFVDLAPSGGAHLELINDAGRLGRQDLDVSWHSAWEMWGRALREAVLDLLTATEHEQLRLVVVSTPFPLGTDRQAALPKAPKWLTDSPGPRLASLLGCSCVLVNEANLAALGEARFGAARGSRVLLYLAVCNGIGAGLVFDGRLFEGATGFAGEIVHAQVAAEGMHCICGNRGCVLTEAVRLPARSSYKYIADAVDAVDAGDEKATEFMEQLGRLVGIPLATAVTILDPDVVVVDARLGPASAAFMTGLSLSVGSRCTPSLVDGLAMREGSLVDSRSWGALAFANDLLAEEHRGNDPTAAHTSLQRREQAQSAAGGGAEH
jgi:predicted NBD/HSP70 family sugar kinase